MSRVGRAFGALLLVVLLVGCQGEVEPRGNASTTAERLIPTSPEKAVQTYQRALADRQWARCWKLLHADTREAYRESAAEFRQTLAGMPDGPDIRALESRLRDMGLTLREARQMSGEQLMTGLLRSQLKNDPEGFRTFVEAECIGHEQVGRTSVVSIRVQGQLHPRQVMTRRSGVLWYIEQSPPRFP